MKKRPYLYFSLISLFILSVVVLGLVVYGHLSWLWAYFLGINAATFCLYWYDKRIAGTQCCRVPEWVLYALAFLGGTPLAILCLFLFRHKVAKDSFTLAFSVILLVQLVLLIKFCF